MTKPTSDSGSTIEKLLQERAQYVSWLTRLNSSGDASSGVPESVRGRVRSDYERRLESVLEELRDHTAALEDQVEGLSARARELTVRETEHREQLAEAEVRHLVGEYDDVKWEGIRAELLKLTGHIRDELSHTTSEIDRLNEVLGTIRAPVSHSTETAPPAPPAPQAPSPVASAPRPVIQASGPRTAMPDVAAAAGGANEIPFRPVTGRQPAAKPAAPPPAAKKDDQPGRTLWFPSGKPDATGPAAATGGKLDELAFLKSVTGGEATPVSSPHLGAAAAPPPNPPAPPPPLPTTQRTRVSGNFTKQPEPPPPPAAEPVARAAPAIDPGKDRPSSGQKTLKCGECGTLNRPTEWYCERCGAELAAL
ncbi:MAG TPA: hypothetical protein VMG41_12660 [Gemmatimonadales bacterium]|nr:hypothetical protein [Gemmatimonadales bacterium]